MSNTFKYLDNENKQQSGNDAAQLFLNEKLSKNKFTKPQDDTLDISENSSDDKYDFSSEYNKTITNQAEIDAFKPVTGGGTERYADYKNTNRGGTQFTDAWQSGARYQQLLGKGSLNNEAFNEQFASAKGGSETGTVADDGGGWKLIKADGGKTSSGRVAQYKDLAEQWQAAGYDVRVQDHNPSYGKKRGSEIAVRVSGQATKKPEPIVKLEKIEKIDKEKIKHSPEIEQAKEQVQTYENDVLSGKVSEDVYGIGSNKFQLDLNKGIDGIGTIGAFNSEKSQLAADSFLDKKKQEVKNQFEFKAQ